MTVIVAVRKDGIISIAADTLTKQGPLKESAVYVANNEKILVVQDNYIAIAGPTSAKRALKHYYNTYEGEVDLSSVDAIFAHWMHLHQALRDTYFLNPSDDEETAFESSHMSVLIANHCGIFGVGAYRAVQEYTRFIAYGRGDEYAMGALYARYNDPAFSAEDLARLAIEAAAEFEDSTGLPVTSYSIKLQEES